MGRKESTIKKHGIRLQVLKKNIIAWTEEEIDSFIIMKRGQGVSNKTLNAYLDTIRLYCRYRKYPIPELQYFKPNTRIKGILSNEEIDKLVNLPCPERSDKLIWEKWSLFFKCCAYTGARPGEIASLNRERIDLGLMTFYFEDTKTNTPRKCPIPKIIQKSISEAYRASEGYIFTTRTGRRFNDDAWRHAFKKRLAILEIDRPNITLYSLRHSFITTLIEEDVSIFKIAKTVGHDPAQTKNYTHLTTKDVERTINKHPLVRAGNETKDVFDYIEEVFKNLGLDERFKSYISRNGKEIEIRIRDIA